MSKRSKIVEKILEKNHREYMDDADAAEEHLKERSAVEDETYKIPKKVYHTNVESKNLFGCQMLTFNDVEDAERMIIYMFGSALKALKHGYIYLFFVSCSKSIKLPNQPNTSAPMTCRYFCSVFYNITLCSRRNIICCFYFFTFQVFPISQFIFVTSKINIYTFSYLNVFQIFTLGIR